MSQAVRAEYVDIFSQHEDVIKACRTAIEDAKKDGANVATLNEKLAEATKEVTAYRLSKKQWAGLKRLY